MTGRGRPTTGTRIEVRVPADILDDLDSLAKREGVTRAVIIRHILEMHIKGESRMT